MQTDYEKLLSNLIRYLQDELNNCLKSQSTSIQDITELRNQLEALIDEYSLIKSG
ncbi:hypothetical protein [Petroclostridium sp. X23]|uniref:hypothetical protein n=1 Tax=Petroclostridium sp. X23 TaxID=3045146 RepID=UPI0024AC99F1|nr:hypothetical protein [Petroclostridium sp. X23]WHH60602.1 hypothetical protein QKW49_07805 [Petroclostridium sp. X23]